MRERPARRRGIADSESGSSVSAASSSDSDVETEPPAKKKTLALVCLVCHLICADREAASCNATQVPRFLVYVRFIFIEIGIMEKGH